MSELKGVIFDMDGTMVDNALYHDEAWKIFTHKHGLEALDLHSMFGMTNETFMKRLFGDNIDVDRIKSLALEKELIYQQIYSDTIEEVKGLTAFLNELSENGLQLAIGTAAPKINVDFVCEKLGVASYFKEVVDDAQVKKGKPDPEIFLLAAKKLGLSPLNCLVIEDSEFGIEAGISAGMKVVAIATTLSKEKLETTQAHLVVNNYTELNTTLLKKLF